MTNNWKAVAEYERKRREAAEEFIKLRGLYDIMAYQLPSYDRWQSLVNTPPPEPEGEDAPEQGTLIGWECPRCRRIHSPFSLQCDCPPPTITGTTFHTTLLSSNTDGKPEPPKSE